MENQTDSIMQGIGIAVFGLGRAGQIHSRNCMNNVRIDLRYVVEIDIEKARKFVLDNRLKETKIISPKEVDTVLDDPLVDGVIIATFTHAHEEQVLQCLRAKKAVFCEKPLAATYEGTENCYREAEKMGVPLLCAFNRRFDPTHKAVKDGVSQGRVGQLQMVKTCSRDSPSPSIEYLKGSPGIFHDCGIHDVDMAMWIVGERPQSVTAQAHAFDKEIKDIGDVDTVAIMMKFPGGVIALIDLSRFTAYGYDQRVEAFGSSGMLQSKNQAATSLCCSDSSGQCDDVVQFSFPQRFETAYKNELEHFLDVVKGGQLLISKDDTLAACRVAQACEDSFKTGQIVDLSWN